MSARSELQKALRAEMQAIKAADKTYLAAQRKLKSLMPKRGKAATKEEKEAIELAQKEVMTAHDEIAHFTKRAEEIVIPELQKMSDYFKQRGILPNRWDL